MGSLKYTKEILEKTVQENISIAGVLRALGLKITGGSHAHISNRIKHYNINTNHFLGQASQRGKKGPRRKKWEEILIIRKADYRQKTPQLVRALLEIGRSYKCAKCGLADEWCGSKLVLQVNHKNSIWTDNRAENLEFLCPNCHSQKTKNNKA